MPQIPRRPLTPKADKEIKLPDLIQEQKKQSQEKAEAFAKEAEKKKARSEAARKGWEKRKQRGYYSQFQSLEDYFTSADISDFVISEFTNARNWQHFTPSLGRKVNNFISDCESYYGRSAVAEGLEEAKNDGVMNEIQTYSYTNTVEDRLFTEITPYIEAAYYRQQIEKQAYQEVDNRTAEEERIRQEAEELDRQISDEYIELGYENFEDEDEDFYNRFS